MKPLALGMTKGDRFYERVTRSSSTQENEVNIEVPWVNIKFANINDGGKKVPASEHEDYKLLSELGISVIGDYVNMTQQAKYKYHIDLGGGGGTTWTVSIYCISSHTLPFITSINSHLSFFILNLYRAQLKSLHFPDYYSII